MEHWYYDIDDIDYECEAEKMQRKFNSWFNKKIPLRAPPRPAEHYKEFENRVRNMSVCENESSDENNLKEQPEAAESYSHKLKSPKAVQGVIGTKAAGNLPAIGDWGNRAGAASDTIATMRSCAFRAPLRPLAHYKNFEFENQVRNTSVCENEQSDGNNFKEQPEIAEMYRHESKSPKSVQGVIGTKAAGNLPAIGDWGNRTGAASETIAMMGSFGSVSAGDISRDKGTSVPTLPIQNEDSDFEDSSLEWLKYWKDVLNENTKLGSGKQKAAGELCARNWKLLENLKVNVILFDEGKNEASVSKTAAAKQPKYMTPRELYMLKRKNVATFK